LADDEIKEVAEAGLNNSQISWVIGDADVKGLFTRLLKEHGKILGPKLKKRLKESLSNA